jgi:prevent-host-death family protein
MRDMGIEEARRALGDIIDRARLLDEPTTITRQGKPAAVIVPIEWYQQVKGLLENGEQS